MSEKVPGRIWVCEDCGWRWPLADVPWQDAECDACGGEMHPEGVSGMSELLELLPAGDQLGTAGPEACTWLTITAGRSTLAGDTLAVAARGPVVGVHDSKGHFWDPGPRDGTWEAPNANALTAHADTIGVIFRLATPENEAVAVRLSPTQTDAERGAYDMAPGQ